MKEIQKYGFKVGLPQEFEILDLKQLLKEFSTETTTPHRTEFYQIIYFEKGTAKHMVDFKEINIKSNTLLFINKNSVQQFDTKNSFDGKIILFTDAFFGKEESDLKFIKSSFLFNDLLNTSTTFISNIPSSIIEIIQLIEKELQLKKDNYQSDIIRNYLKNFLFLAERERKNQDFIEIKKGADLDIVISFKDLLEQHYHTEKLVINYAEKLFITKKRLNLATSKILDLTPKEIIDARIILEAKRLLVHTNESVKEIGFKLGFDETTNFVKYFKKNQNCTPLEFRINFKP